MSAAIHPKEPSIAKDAGMHDDAMVIPADPVECAFPKYFLHTKGPSGFSSSSTAEEVSAGWSGQGKVAIITGPATGLGLEALRVLVMHGCEVFAGVRSPAKMETALEPIRKQYPDAKVTVLPLDLSSLESVRAFAAAFQAKRKGVNILMCNAGIMSVPFGLSKDGHEMQFATNHLGHFLLANLLTPQLVYAAAQPGAPEGRVVITSSALHKMNEYPEKIRFDKLDSPEGYSTMNAYGQSKLCNVLHGRELARRLHGQNVAVVSVHPGVIFQTELGGVMPAAVKSVLKVVARPFLKNIAGGAATQVYVATTATVASGAYYSDSNLDAPSAAGQDDALAARLWEFSERLCNKA